MNISTKETSEVQIFWAFIPKNLLRRSRVEPKDPYSWYSDNMMILWNVFSEAAMAYKCKSSLKSRDGLYFIYQCVNPASSTILKSKKLSLKALNREGRKWREKVKTPIFYNRVPGFEFQLCSPIQLPTNIYAGQYLPSNWDSTTWQTQI